MKLYEIKISGPGGDVVSKKTFTEDRRRPITIAQVSLKCLASN